MACSNCGRHFQHETNASCERCLFASRRWKRNNRVKNMLIIHKRRDIRKGQYNEAEFCTEAHIEACRKELDDHCFHCNCKIHMFTHPDRQLTIQRLRNEIGHICTNCTIACISCNRHRVESSIAGEQWLRKRIHEIEFEKLVRGGYQVLGIRVPKMVI